MAVDYDVLYNPRLTVSNFQEVFQRWAADSQRARAAADCVLDVPYGADETEKLDVFRAQGASRALLVFIHGGYWRSLDKRDFSFIAPAFTRAGVTVAIPNYALCPKVTVEDIVRQMLQATAWLYRNGVNFGAPRNQVYVAGHSAGGHLTAMMLAAMWPVYAADLPKTVVAGGLSISGVYDLAEIAKTPSINIDVRLNERTAPKVSPIIYPPATNAPLYTAVGSDENEGFHIQNRLIGKKWKAVLKGDIPCAGDNHFTVLDRLITPGSSLHSGTLAMMGIR
jgi:arylformamidase